MDRRPRRLPSLDLLRGFEAAARHLSFTRAAAELNVTQSAISHQIRALEEALGRPVFVRARSGLELTEAGLALLGVAAAALRQVDDAWSRIRGPDGERPLTVSTTVSFASLWLVPRLPAFRRLHPGVDVRISATNEMLDLDRGQIDLAIRFCEPAKAPPGARRLAGEEVFPVCSPALLADRRRPLRKPADLASHVLLHLDDSVGQWPWLGWPQWLEALGLSDVRPSGALRFSHYDQLVRAAVDGEGVALGRNPLIRSNLASGTLVSAFGRSVTSSRQYFLVEGSRASSPVRAAFVEWLVAALASEEAPAPPRRASRARPKAPLRA